MTIYSRRAAALSASLIREVAETGMKMYDIIPLWFGEGQWPTAMPAIKAARAALDHDHFYQPNSGKPALREALCDYMNRLYNCHVTPPSITVTGSGMQGLMLTAQALCDPADKVIVIGPVWPNLAESFRIVGADISFVHLSAHQGRWQLDMDRLLGLLGDDVKAVLVNSPNNPTGWVMTQSEQDILLSHCRRNGIWIVSDDVYSRLYRHGRAAPHLFSLASPEDRIISVNSFSKAWSMTGWRLGWVAAPPELEATLAQLTEFNISCTAGFIQEAGLAMLTDGEPEIQQLTQKLADSFALTQSRLSALPDISFIQPDGAFYSFFSIRGMTDSTRFCKSLLHTAGVGLAPGRAFGPEAEGFVRLCYAQPAERLKTAFDRFADGYRAAL